MSKQTLLDTITDILVKHGITITSIPIYASMLLFALTGFIPISAIIFGAMITVGVGKMIIDKIKDIIPATQIR